MFCRHCGNEIDDDVIICMKCGKQVQDLKQDQVKAKVTTQKINKAVEDTNAWYYEWWFIILMFVVFFPIGIVLMIVKLMNEKK